VSLGSIHDGGVFDDATTDERRTQVYVRSGELGLPVRADLKLMQTLTEREFPQRLHIVGPSGAGKTSLILRVAADLIRLEGARRQLLRQPQGGLRDSRVRAERVEGPQ